MYVSKSKTMAILGVLAALSTVLTVLGTVISVNTIFFTAMAAFLAGIVAIRFGMGHGVVFFGVCALLDFIFNPNKLHLFLYLGLGGYLLLSEGSYRVFQKKMSNRLGWLHRGLRLFFFLLLYLPLLIFVPKLLISEELMKMSGFYPLMFVGGLLAWIVYDIAYGAFKRYFYERFGRMI